ncbi:uncharacterized protein LOC129137475 isoform X4 [Pan troglodytes]|uniref:uncharacterized protein LOC129137475 isoform X4 n=1 Tax=Pan troglodytes TaxID=9598 RepID=UPI003013DC84
MACRIIPLSRFSPRTLDNAGFSYVHHQRAYPASGVYLDSWAHGPFLHLQTSNDGAEPDTLTGSLGVLQRSNKRHLCPVASILGSCSMFDYISPYSFENSSSDWNDLEQPAE